MIQTLQTVKSRIASGNIQFVRFVWCDNAGVTGTKAVHTKFIADYFKARGVGITEAQQAIPVMSNSVVAESGLSAAREVHMRADWNTFTPLPYAPGHARVFIDFYDGGKPWSHCPRTFLRSVIDRAAKLGFMFQAAFEDEFYLLKEKDGSFAPIDQTVYGQTIALDFSHDILSDIASALAAQGMYPEQLYAEDGNGQFEIPIRYTDALSAADNQVAFRETVHGVAARHEGIAASFVPKMYADKAGTGAHLHLSIWENGKNIMADEKKPHTISKKAGWFIAGILHHLPALMAMTTPSTNSYKRIRPHFWSGAYRCWGYGNREGAVRIPTPDSHDSVTNFELKTVDSSCNPYIALGAVLAAGLDGIEKQMALDKPVDNDPADLPEKEKEKRGIVPLPTNLGLAIAHLQKDSVLLNALGPDLARSFLAVRSAEWKKMKDMTVEEEAALLRERY